MSKKQAIGVLIISVAVLAYGLQLGYEIGHGDSIKESENRAILCGYGVGYLDHSPTWEPLNQTELLDLCNK